MEKCSILTHNWIWREMTFLLIFEYISFRLYNSVYSKTQLRATRVWAGIVTFNIKNYYCCNILEPLQHCCALYDGLYNNRWRLVVFCVFVSPVCNQSDIRLRLTFPSVVYYSYSAVIDDGASTIRTNTNPLRARTGISVSIAWME